MLRGSSVALLVISITSVSCFRAVAPLLRCDSLGAFPRAFGGARRLRGARSHSTLAMALPPEVQYERLAAIPAVAGGFLLPKPTSAAGPPPVLLRRNQKDLFNNEPRSHLLQFSPLGDQLTRQAFPTELRDVGAMVPAPSGELLALVRTRTVDGKKEQSLEVWNGDMLVATVKANAEQHGDIYTADVFSSFEWSPDSSRLLYVAETPKAKTKSFWRQNCESGEKGVGKDHSYQDDWGELSTGKSLSRLFVLHVPTKTVKAVEGVPSRFAAGQAIWSPDSTAVVFTAFDIEPRRLDRDCLQSLRTCTAKDDLFCNMLCLDLLMSAPASASGSTTRANLESPFSQPRHFLRLRKLIRRSKAFRFHLLPLSRRRTRCVGSVQKRNGRRAIQS